MSPASVCCQGGILQLVPQCPHVLPFLSFVLRQCLTDFVAQAILELPGARIVGMGHHA